MTSGSLSTGRSRGHWFEGVLGGESAPGMTLGEFICLTGVGVLLAGVKVGSRLHLGIPGSSGLLWIPLLVLARLTAGYRLAGLYVMATGAVTGWLFPVVGGYSPVAKWLAFFVAGGAVDFVHWWRRRREGGGHGFFPGWGGGLAYGICASLAVYTVKAGTGSIRPHLWTLGLGPMLFPLASYLIAGLSAGVLVGVVSRLVDHRRPNNV